MTKPLPYSQAATPENIRDSSSFEAYKAYRTHKPKNSAKPPTVKNIPNEQEKLAALKFKWGAGFDEVVRLYRILQAKKLWFAELRKKVKDIKTITEGQKLFTYDKKEFFIKTISAQNAKQIIDGLAKEMNLPKNIILGSEDYLKNLRMRNNGCDKAIAQLQKKLKQPQSFLEKVSTTAWLAVTQHPECQLGKKTFEAASKELEGKPGFLGEKLPADLQELAGNITGAGFLGTLLLSQQIMGWGGCHQLISAIRPVLLAQHDAIKNWTGFDELTLAERDKMIQWVAGLIVLLPVSGISIPVIAAYCLATGAAELASTIIKNKGAKYNFNPETIGLVSAIVHMVVYSKVYQWTIPYIPSLASTTPPTPTQKEKCAEALSRFGFNASTTPTRKEVERTYHKFAVKFHPDKCTGTECTTEMAILNTAHDLLLKSGECKLRL